MGSAGAGASGACAGALWGTEPKSWGAAASAGASARRARFATASGAPAPRGRSGSGRLGAPRGRGHLGSSGARRDQTPPGALAGGQGGVEGGQAGQAERGGRPGSRAAGPGRIVALRRRPRAASSVSPAWAAGRTPSGPAIGASRPRPAGPRPAGRAGRPAGPGAARPPARARPATWATFWAANSSSSQPQTSRTAYQGPCGPIRCQAPRRRVRGQGGSRATPGAATVAGFSGQSWPPSAAPAGLGTSRSMRTAAGPLART